MVDVIYYVLLAMAVIYFIWLFIGELTRKIFKFKFCAICATIVSTWAILLVLKLNEFAIDKTILAILMGQSITGAVYFLERKRSKKRLLLMKPLIILLGTLIVYWIVSGVS